ncbi:MAG TPA: hypothetical protein VG097_14090 [Gemmata sp.]|jgi:hypothetical protein|nr:hypothetical protein [Gemmata sp.]
MFSGSSLMPTDVLAVFTKEVLASQGRVSETFDDGKRMFSRSILPHIEDVRPGDQLRGGVALKATENEVWMFPYIFRLVCSNGAIAAQTVDSWSLEDLHIIEPEFATQSIREGFAVCSRADTFHDNVRRMRNAAQVEADFTISLLPFLSRYARGDVGLIAQIMNQFSREGDRSQFGLANAVTAIARDTNDPALRWDLEELGGSIATGRISPTPTKGPGRARSKELAVG